MAASTSSYDASRERQTHVLDTAPAIDTATTIDTALAIDTVERARARIEHGALSPSSIGLVGLELEMHLVDLARPADRVSWERLTDLVAALPPMPSRSAVTLEPGSQVELSTLPMPDVSEAVKALEADSRALRAAFAHEGLGLASLGADPARPSQRMSPAARYQAMERHFDATGSSEAGRAMMCSTAALQVNVEAGPSATWPIRVSRMHRLGPVLVAISACSPALGGRSSGWRSMRQQVWGDIDQARCGPLLEGAHPEHEWATYALDAPVMLVRDADLVGAKGMTERISFSQWIDGLWVDGDPQIDRPPTVDDLDYHLSTLFPPVRPRGFLELRCLDAVPHHWWPGLAGIAVTLLDDPVAANRAAEACAPLVDAWTSAARDGLTDPVIARAARECVEAAVERAPAGLKAQMEEYADLVACGRTPGDEIREQIEAHGALAVLKAQTDA